MKKRIASVLLVLILAAGILPGAAASGGLVHFTRVHTYKSGLFADVATSQWYAPYVQTVYEYGLMNGKSDAAFVPDEELTIGEAVKLAACLHRIYYAGYADFAASDPWYAVYAGYALNNGVISSEYADYNAKATRSEFAKILAGALPEEALAVKNAVEDNSIPDVPISYPYAPAVYKLYRAGVLTGSDASGRFLPNDSIKRAEVAAVVARMAVPALRQTVKLSLSLTTEQLFEMCSPAVFFIRIYDIKDTPIKIGSGFFIDSSGLAVTNYHVIRGAARAVITMSDGEEYEVAGVCDYSKEKDLTLIKISGGDFPYLRMGDPSTVATGADAYAIGSPLGLRNTISKGIISGVSRTINGNTYIQTTAAISSGSSGGALLDGAGRVIGVTTGTFDGTQNVNFAVPITALGDFRKDRLLLLQSILPDTKYYADYYPVPDFGAFAGAPVFKSNVGGLMATYFYAVSDLSELEEIVLNDYAELLEENVFQFYGYAIENGRIITYYINTAYGVIVTFGSVEYDERDCIRVQITQA